jgi:transposase
VDGTGASPGRLGAHRSDSSQSTALSKGKVEAGVKYVRRNCFDPRKDERDLDVLNVRIPRIVITQIAAS